MSIRANVWNLRGLSENMLKFAETEEDKMGNKNQEKKEYLSMEILKMVLTVELEKIRSRMFFRVLNVLGKNQIFSHCRC